MCAQSSICVVVNYDYYVILKKPSQPTNCSCLKFRLRATNFIFACKITEFKITEINFMVFQDFSDCLSGSRINSIYLPEYRPTKVFYKT